MPLFNKAGHCSHRIEPPISDLMEIGMFFRSRFGKELAFRAAFGAVVGCVIETLEPVAASSADVIPRLAENFVSNMPDPWN